MRVDETITDLCDGDKHLIAREWLTVDMVQAWYLDDLAAEVAHARALMEI